HLSHEGLDLEDPANQPMYEKKGFLEMSVSPKQAPDQSEYVTISFEKGIPVAVNGEKMDGVALIEKLNEIGGAILFKAHELLEQICLDRDTLHYKNIVAEQFAELTYFGKWFTPLHEAIRAFIDKTQEHVTGDVKIELYKGNMIPAGVTSPYSQYYEELATFGEDAVYDQAQSKGFIDLFGLSIKMNALAKQGKIK
ncbi:MAG: argininosuccinate synthase, partial [Clostridia bacterium]|nr:argininosuccinate synthase [Clostridia bacterium]